MPPIDAFAQTLLEQSKRFLEKSQEEQSAEGKSAYLNAALSLCFCTLEASVNSIADDFVERPELTVLDLSVMTEKEVRLKEGAHELGGFKMVRLEDRIQFLRLRFSGQPLDRTQAWWSQLQEGLKLRNQLAHPKDVPAITKDAVGRGIESVLAVLDDLYQAIYKVPYPARRLGLRTQLSF